MANDMSDENKDLVQNQNVGSDGSEVEKQPTGTGEIARIVCSANRDAFDALYIDAGGKPKWKSREKFIMAGCTLLKKVTLGEIVMIQGRKGNGSAATRIDVIEVTIPAKRLGRPPAEKGEDDDDEKDDVPAPDPMVSDIENAFGTNSSHPIARYVVLVNKVMKAESDRDKVVAEAEKVVSTAQKTLDSFLNNNWDVLKKSRLFSPAVEKEMKERARLAEIKNAEDNAEKRKEMAALERDAARDK